MEVKSLCPVTWTMLTAEQQLLWQEALDDGSDVRDSLRPLVSEGSWLPDLAAVEQANCRLRLQLPAPTFSDHSDNITVNPGLEVVEVAWQGLLDVVAGKLLEPQPGTEFLLFWRHPRNGVFRSEVATPADLLALKIVVEHLDPRAVADTSMQPVGYIDRMMEKAQLRGVLLKPPSKLTRCADDFFIAPDVAPRFLSSPAFTLQWHITQKCDLHCRHCYDRSDLADISLNQGMKLLDQMRDFCFKHHVYGQISFSGGNPFMHPDFFTLYRAAVERNLTVAVLGNPVSENRLRELITIEPPAFYQVSLEGMEKHNDEIRGAGNFADVGRFLRILKKLKISSRVMLTLTEENIGEVLPLAEFLRDKADLFTYNRLSMVGEGAALKSALGKNYQGFIRDYIEARKNNPTMAQKDNLINIERFNQGLEPFGGCTGYGCGAAFNFVAILPSGEVHACRKYPSPIGNIHHHDLEKIYYSAAARAYRKGPQECTECRLRAVCGGCPAVTYGCGDAPLEKKDPACFVDRPALPSI